MILTITGLTAELSELYPYVNTDIVTAMQQAVAQIHPGTDIPDYHINLETSGIIQATDGAGVRFIYNIKSSEVTAEMQADSFATTVENCMKKQPYLAQFWGTYFFLCCVFFFFCSPVVG